MPLLRSSLDRLQRNAKIIDLYKQGVKCTQLRERFGLSEAEIFRIIKCDGFLDRLKIRKRSLEMARFIRKHVSVEAVQYLGNNVQEIVKFCRTTLFDVIGPARTLIITASIDTDFQFLTLYQTDWIIRSKSGCLQTCKNMMFKEVWEPVTQELLELQSGEQVT